MKPTREVNESSRISTPSKSENEPSINVQHITPLPISTPNPESKMPFITAAEAREIADTTLQKHVQLLPGPISSELKNDEYIITYWIPPIDGDNVLAPDFQFRVRIDSKTGKVKEVTHAKE